MPASQGSKGENEMVVAKNERLFWGSKLELTLGVLFCSLIELGKCSSTFAPMPFSTPYRTKFVLNIL